MLMTRIDASAHWRDFVVVRLLRRWTAEGAAGGSQLPSLVGLAGELGEQPEAAIAIASLFQLTEACLARPLQGECCCSPDLSRDELAILLLLDSASALGTGQSTQVIPHGLPGALIWAAKSVNHLLGDAGVARPDSRGCPFGG